MTAISSCLTLERPWMAEPLTATVRGPRVAGAILSALAALLLVVGGADVGAQLNSAAAVIDVDEAVVGGTLIQLADPLDEPEYYCIDVPGFGARLNLGAALMAHTCKPGAADEMFAVNRPAAGNLSMPAYDLCMQADGTEAAAELHLEECADSELQRFTYAPEGALTLSGTDLCIALAPDAGRPTGGPSHLRRDLLLQPCDTVESALSRWMFPGPSPE